MNERWRTELALRSFRPDAWRYLCNRNEYLTSKALGAVFCEWGGSSYLTVARTFPAVGGRILRACLKEFPLCFDEAARSQARNLSIILPVAGRDRLPAVRMVLAAFAAQKGGAPEVVLVEHSECQEFSALSSDAVRYLHVPRAKDEPFNKSRALNKGVQQALHSRLVLHDADAVPPAGLCDVVEDFFDRGFEGATPARFLFMFDKEATDLFISGWGNILPSEVSEVMQNFPGLCQAVTRAAYQELGGYDERFQGWGGEDEEFLQRLRTRRLLPGGLVPMVHLWHPPAPKKASGDRNRELSTQVFSESPGDRIKRLLRSRTE